MGLVVALVAAGGALSSCIFVYGEADAGIGGAAVVGGGGAGTSLAAGGFGGSGLAGGGGGSGGSGGECGAPYTTQDRPEIADLAVALDGAAVFIGPAFGPGCDRGATQLAFYQSSTGPFDDATPTWCAPLTMEGLGAKERILAITSQRVALAFTAGAGANLMLFGRSAPDLVTNAFAVQDGSIGIRAMAAAGDKLFLSGTITTTNEVANVSVTVNGDPCLVGEIAPGDAGKTRTFVARVNEDGSQCTMAVAALTDSDFESMAVNGKDVLMRRLLPSAGGSDLIRVDQNFSVQSGVVQRAGITPEAATVDFRRLAGAGNAWRTLSGSKVLGGNTGACCDGMCCTMNANQACCAPSGALWPTVGPSILFDTVNGLTANPMNGDAFAFGSGVPVTSGPSVPRVLAVWNGGNATQTWGPDEWPDGRVGEALAVRPIAEGAEVFTFGQGSTACRDRWVLERWLFTLGGH